MDLDHRIYFGEEASGVDGRIWLYDVQQHAVSSRWPAVRDSSLPISTFVSKAGIIKKITRCCPPNSVFLHRVVVRHSNKQDTARTHFGFWSADRTILLQYKWSDGSHILDTNTSQLRALQAQHRFRPHTAAVRWERELGCIIPGGLWKETWVNFRGANENTFLWQLFYRAIATQRWRFPSILLMILFLSVRAVLLELKKTSCTVCGAALYRIPVGNGDY